MEEAKATGTATTSFDLDENVAQCPPPLELDDSKPSLKRRLDHGRLESAYLQPSHIDREIPAGRHARGEGKAAFRAFRIFGGRQSAGRD
jgi:hypothetical protein